MMGVKPTSVESPGDSKHMLWVRDVALPYTGDACLIWPYGREPTGYASSRRRGKKIYYHRYICELVHGAPPTPKHHAAHSCDNGPGGCVNPKHLSWKTNAENQLDRYRSRPQGGRFKLLPHQVEEIRGARGKEHITAIAARFGISVSHAKNIQTGQARPSGADFKFLSDAQVNEVRRFAGTMADRKVGLLLGINERVVFKIRRGLSYRHVPTLSGGHAGETK